MQNTKILYSEHGYLEKKGRKLGKRCVQVEILKMVSLA